MVETYIFRGDFGGIGLAFDDEDEFAVMTERVLERATEIPAPGGRYYVSADGNGAEFWLLVDLDNELIAAHPFLRGKGRIEAGVTGPVETRMRSELDATLHAWAEPGSALQDGIYPFLVTCIDWDRHKNRPLPFREALSIAVFPRELKIYPSIAAYDAEPARDGARLAARAFVPAGLFTNGDAEPDSIAWFTGSVQETALHTNPVSGLPYGRALVETLGGSVEVGLDMEVVPDLPPKGAILEVYGWLGTTLGLAR